MQPIRIVSRKYDGRLRDEYEALLYAEDDERLVVYAPVGTLSYDRRAQTWVPAPDGLLEIYFKTRWYNVWHICEQTSNINQLKFLYRTLACESLNATNCGRSIFGSGLNDVEIANERGIIDLATEQLGASENRGE